MPGAYCHRDISFLLMVCHSGHLAPFYLQSVSTKRPSPAFFVISPLDPLYISKSVNTFRCILILISLVNVLPVNLCLRKHSIRTMSFFLPTFIFGAMLSYLMLYSDMNCQVICTQDLVSIRS